MWKKNFEHAEEVTFLGDVNIDLFDINLRHRWNNNVISQFSLTQIESEATRVTESTNTLTDHVYTNSPNNFCAAVVEKYSLSNHY